MGQKRPSTPLIACFRLSSGSGPGWRAGPRTSEMGQQRKQPRASDLALLGFHRSPLVTQQEQSARELNPFQLCVAPSGYLGLRKSRIGEASNWNADEIRQELKSCAHCRTTQRAENAFDVPA